MCLTVRSVLRSALRRVYCYALRVPNVHPLPNLVRMVIFAGTTGKGCTCTPSFLQLLCSVCVATYSEDRSLCTPFSSVLMHVKWHTGYRRKYAGTLAARDAAATSTDIMYTRQEQISSKGQSATKLFLTGTRNIYHTAMQKFILAVAERQRAVSVQLPSPGFEDKRGSGR